MALTAEMIADINDGTYLTPQDNMGRTPVLGNKMLGIEVSDDMQNDGIQNNGPAATPFDFN